MPAVNLSPYTLPGFAGEHRRPPSQDPGTNPRAYLDAAAEALAGADSAVLGPAQGALILAACALLGPTNVRVACPVDGGFALLSAAQPPAAPDPDMEIPTVPRRGARRAEG